MRNKISVVGSGFVGSTLAQRLAEMDLGDVVLLDILDGIPQGKGLDIYESSAVEGFCSNVIGTCSYEDIAGSDIVVVTAGLARKPGMTREDLLLKNAEIISAIASQIKKFAPESIIIVVTNPLDVMTQLVQYVTGFSAHRVLGMAGILDSARMCSFIAMELNVAPTDIHAMVLGGHGDTMVPLARYTTVSGIPITELIPAEKIEQINQRTRDGGAEIVKLLKTGSAYYAPSSACAQMVDAILKDKKRILPCSVLLTGQYGVYGIYVGVPIKLGRSGVEAIIELKLDSLELEALHKSANVVKENFDFITKQ